MTFKVLPSKSLDDQTFARNPIGSGPFMYGGRATKGGREYAIFPANPGYNRPNPPRLKAVWMVTSRNDVTEQPGLKSDKGPVDVYVIDQAEKPSEN